VIADEDLDDKDKLKLKLEKNDSAMQIED